MPVDAERCTSDPLPLTAKRQFKGSIFDAADARRFARITAEWWDVDTGVVEHVVEELALRAICRERPGFSVSLSLDGGDVRVRVDELATDPPALEGPARLQYLRERGAAGRH